MPGIESRAPERTETSSGFLRSPNVLPVCCSIDAMPASICAAQRRPDTSACWRSSRCRPRCVMVKPGGTGRPMRHISARFAPLPPSSGFIVAVAVGLACRIDKRIFPTLLAKSEIANWRMANGGRRAGLPTVHAGRSISWCSFLPYDCAYSDCGTMSEISASERMRDSSRCISCSRARLSGASSTMTKTSVKNRSTAGPNLAASANA